MINDADVPPLPQAEFRNNIDSGVGSTSPVMLPAACKTLVVGSNVDNQDDWSDNTPNGKWSESDNGLNEDNIGMSWKAAV